jgi:general secretion pathway protein I
MPAAGFTLMEVLVALVIVAFGMGAVLAALSASANNTAALRERTVAEWLALNQLTTTRIAATALSDGTSEGDVDSYANGQWHWLQTVEELDVPGVQRITIQVRRSTANDSAAAKDSWLATVVGFRGSSVTRPDGNLPNWTGSSFAGTNGQGGNGGGRIRNPGAPQTGDSVPSEGALGTPAPTPPASPLPTPTPTPDTPATPGGG